MNDKSTRRARKGKPPAPKFHVGQMAKPAGESRPRWTLFRNEHAGGYDVLDREMMFAHVPTLPDAERIVAALNAAETRAAQPPDRLSILKEAAACCDELGAETWQDCKRRILALIPTPEYRCQYWRYTSGGHCVRCDWNDRSRAAQPGDAPKLTGEYPWSLETMALINKLTPDIKGKAFDPDWFLLRNRLEQFEANALLASRSTPAAPAPPRFLEGAAAERVQKLLDDAEGTFAAPAATPPDGLEFRRIGSHTGEFSAPAPASTEAPGALGADEIVERCAAVANECLRCAGETRREILALKGTFTLAAPSTEALIAAGDALQDKLDVACEAVKAGMAERAALQAAGDALESAADDLESVPYMNMRLWTNYLEAKYTWRAAVATLHPANAARPGGEGTLSRLREGLCKLLDKWNRRIENEPMPTDAEIAYSTCVRQLEAALAELERPRDLPSV